MGEGGFRCSLNLSEKVLADSPMYSSSAFNPVTFVSVNDTTFVQAYGPYLYSHEEVLDGVSSFTMHLDAIFLTSSFDSFAHQSPDDKAL